MQACRNGAVFSMKLLVGALDVLWGLASRRAKLRCGAVVANLVFGVGVVGATGALAYGYHAKLPAPASGAAAQLEGLLAKGRAATGHETVQMGEILGIAAPGSGEMVRIHSVWNDAKHVQADAVTILVGRLGADLPSEQVVSTVDVTKGRDTWIKSTRAGVKWTYERAPTPTASSTALLGDLLAVAGGRRVTRVSSTRKGSTWRITYTASDLQVLDALRSQLPASAKLSAKQRSLLAGERFTVSDLKISLDSRGRMTDVRLGGIVTETRADSAARGQPYPQKGIKSVVLLHLVYTYGGSLAVTPPPTRDVINPKKPIK
jgi:hypothetical protein